MAAGNSYTEYGCEPQQPTLQSFSQIWAQPGNNFKNIEQAGSTWQEGVQSAQRGSAENGPQNSKKCHNEDDADAVLSCVLSEISASENQMQSTNSLDTHQRNDVPCTKTGVKSKETKDRLDHMSVLQQGENDTKGNGKFGADDQAESVSAPKRGRKTKKQRRKERELERQAGKMPRPKNNSTPSVGYYYRNLQLKDQERRKQSELESQAQQKTSPNAEPGRDYNSRHMQKSESRKERRRMRKMEKSVSSTPPRTTRVISSVGSPQCTHSNVFQKLSKNGQHQVNQKFVCIPPLPVDTSSDCATKSRQNDRAVVGAAVSDDLDVYDRTEASYARSNIETDISETHSSNSDADSAHNSELSLSTFLDQLLQISPENNVADKIEQIEPSLCVRCKFRPVSAGVLHRQR